MNRAIKEVNTPITVFCDDNTFLNKDAINQLVKHYADPRIGAVAGEKKVMDLNTGNAASTGESFYWKYESFLKKMDFEFYSVVGAAGELFSVRTALFKEPEEDTLLDDFIISLRICMMGYRVAYEPEAYALERPSASLRDEQKRKIRISAGGFQSIVRLRSLLNIFKYGKLSFQYISHRVLRWAVCPFLLPVLIVTNLFIVMGSGEVIYQLLMTGQLIFYLAALGGWLFSRSNIKFRLFSFPYYFLFINISLYHGLIRYFRGSQSVLWEKAERDI
jgi:cellulose synthase/poly-beta-1,6-N-acetylglucosamine synthase-like glycosyltransferase